MCAIQSAVGIISIYYSGRFGAFMILLRFPWVGEIRNLWVAWKKEPSIPNRHAKTREFMSAPEMWGIGRFFTWAFQRAFQSAIPTSCTCRSRLRITSETTFISPRAAAAMGSLCCKRSVARTSADVPGPTEKSVAVLATDNDSSMWLVSYRTLWWCQVGVRVLFHGERGSDGSRMVKIVFFVCFWGDGSVKSFLAAYMHTHTPMGCLWGA